MSKSRAIRMLARRATLLQIEISLCQTCLTEGSARGTLVTAQNLHRGQGFIGSNSNGLCAVE